MGIIEICLVVACIIIITLVIGIHNLLKQTEQLDDIISFNKQTYLELVESALKSMRDADLRGSFESDDEVGSAFGDIKKIIEQLKHDLGYNDKDEKKKEEI